MIFAGAGEKHGGMDVGLGMIVYSLLLTLGLGVSAPWWLWRIATNQRYRRGLPGRLGWIPRGLRVVIRGRNVVWLHAVSVGETLAAERLIGELKQALPGYVIVISTTTATGQTLAKQRFGNDVVFWFPLDFAFTVRRYLQLLRPKLVVMMESELWPRLLFECERQLIPVAVVNARMSDRSFRRAMRVKGLWGWMAGRVNLFLAQGEETAGRLVRLGVRPERVMATGNLKYDTAPAAGENAVVTGLRTLAAGRPVVVAGSTLPGEEELVLAAWAELLRSRPETLLVLAPRHAQRFREVEKLLLDKWEGRWFAVSSEELRESVPVVEGGAVFLLDTLGDLAAVYELASVAFIGGSLVAKGGHNPLEAARFGVPVMMGPSYENFREMVDGMVAARAVRIVEADGLGAALAELLQDDGGMGERGRRFCEAQSGATGRTVTALLELMERGR